MISLDTETTGVDFHHGARPFLITSCNDEGEVSTWEWTVDPLTRMPDVPDEDLEEIAEVVLQADSIVGQNFKFDVKALNSIGVASSVWHKLQDTLIAGHLLASNQPHDLTSMAIQYLGVDIEPFERRLEVAVKQARKRVQLARLREKRDGQGDPLALWRIADKGLPEMPSARESTWKYDTWLPKAFCEIGEGEEGWDTVLAEYANTDSSTTLLLWRAMRSELEQRGLWEIYLERLKVLPIGAMMEQRGVTVSRARLDELTEEYERESERSGRICVNVAKGLGYDLELPRSGCNGSLRRFLFGTAESPRSAVLPLPILKCSDKTGEPSLDKEVLDSYLSILPANSKAMTFAKALRNKRKRDTAVSYMDGYRRFWLPWSIPLGHGKFLGDKDWFVLHPSLNPTGTDTLRWSSSNPNEQNISKQEGFNLRYAFGPAPGREWWSLDAKNIELRLPAYESGESEMMDLFEHPDDPPYFGSNHLLNAHVLWPELFEACLDENGNLDGRVFKKRYASSNYQRVKNGGFKLQYGGVDADSTFRLVGATILLRNKFSKLDDLNRRWIKFAEKMGYVETMPDRTVNAKHGYPLLCSRTERGYVKPTVPLNYHVQGTAMWWMARAMVRCQAKLEEWNREGFDGHIALQVHDELVFDFPKSKKPVQEQAKSKWKLSGDTLWRVKVLAKLMEQGGEDLIPRVPTPVGVEYHPIHWGEGVTL